VGNIRKYYSEAMLRVEELTDDRRAFEAVSTNPLQAIEP
jgi:hypothetical protein